MEAFTELFIRILLSVFFIGFMMKTIITGIRTRQSVRGRSFKMNLVILNSIILGIVAFTNYPDYYFRIEILDYSAVKIIGLVFVTLACVSGISTLITMKDSWRVGILPDQKTDLITNGIFKYSRNPFYLAFDLMFLGIFFEYPTLVYLILYLTFIMILHLIIRDEEIHLMVQHGESYKNYKKSVKRYFSLPFRN